MSFRPIHSTILAVAVSVLLGVVASAPAQIDVKPPEGGANRTQEQDPALQAHIGYLINLINHKNKIIRRSAHQGLAGVGRAALPALDGLAGDRTSERAKIAARIAGTIRKRMDRASTRNVDAAGAKGKKRRNRRQPGVSDKALTQALEAAGADATLAGKVKPVVDDHRRRMRELRKQNRGMEPREAREQRTQLAREYRNQLSGILGGDEKAAAFIKALNRGRGKRKGKAPSDASDA